jgi:UDP-N-acetylglucosamine transferase subunit ALG13
VIFATIGTTEPFDRLVRAVIALDGGEQIVVQSGGSDTGPDSPTRLTYLPYDEIVRLMRDSRVVVMHAGVGSVLTAIRVGKRPVVVPRLRRYGEAVDDHQVAFARKLGELGAAVVVEDLAGLRQAVDEAAASPPPSHRSSTLGAAVGERVSVLLRRHLSGVSKS